MTFIIIGKRKPTKKQPAVTVVWDGTHRGSLLIGRAKFGTRSYCDGALDGLRLRENAPVAWAGIVEVPEALAEALGLSDQAASTANGPEASDLGKGLS